jgi:hypothetical protein
LHGSPAPASPREPPSIERMHDVSLVSSIPWLCAMQALQ